MFSRMSIMKSAKSGLSEIERLKEALETADSVVIGAGAGLSASAGFIYTGERFRQYFSDFEEKYRFHDMYTGGFYPYQTLEEHWAYWTGISTLTVIWTRRNRYIRNCLDW